MKSAQLIRMQELQELARIGYKVHKLQELANQGEAVVWELSSVITAEQLVSPKSPSEKRINEEGSSIKAVAQAI